MNPFTAEWLALREPADHAARDRGLMTALGRALARQDRPLRVVDLGSGTGSNLRALAPWLPERQLWSLVDHDERLLDAARERLRDWADEASAEGDTLRLVKDGRDIAVSFRCLDLAAGFEAALEPAPDLVTAAALFDLLSPAAIAEFAASVAARRAVFHTALTYDGCEEWRPPHPADASVAAAFHAHQEGEKGFGAAAGPRAAEALAEAFRSGGYRVESAATPWRLGADDASLIRRLVGDKARAVAETGRLGEAEVEAWRSARSRPGVTALIGHVDTLALPPDAPA
ncbi:class I SAM-dependent methyltransferase [Enterovirga rhinocerotis]|uniref:Methyltransferase family protein n=1 Tax=Enterovirga rhinocerotis TaxID=1339210 RepID=A0A4R7BWH1_9HYPH|nr:class I SAM-dependent methyltransferase [Enterovirga rhinocerotis]TDR89025.1 hypothetical protein EV668_3510 [Enterovirga rhinocerotis]